MKKISHHVTRAILFVFVMMALVPAHLAYADVNTAQSIDTLYGKVLPSSTNPEVTLKVSRTSEITATSARFDIDLQVVKNVPNSITATVLVIDVYNAAGQKVADQEVAFSRSDLKPREEITFTTPVFPNLQQGKTYTFQIEDAIQNPRVVYQKVSFKTKQASVSETSATIEEQKNAFQASAPRVYAFESIGDNYDAKISGTFVTDLNMRVKLKLMMGEGDSLYSRGTIYPEKLVEANTEQSYSETITRLKPGTTYNYQIYEETKNFPATPVYVFSTPGTPPTAPVPFDNDAAGILGDYEFPTNIGEPGAYTAPPLDENSMDPLVPCGKRGDQDNPDTKDCKLQHFIQLIQNIINFLLILLVPLTVLVCIYTGVQMIIHRGIPADLAKYKENLKRIGIGIALMLLAFTIVATFLQTLLPEGSTSFNLIELVR